MPQIKKQQLLLDKDAIRKGRSLYRALNNKYRRQILQLLHRKEEMRVTDIYAALKMEQSTISLHLAILRHADVLHARRDGKQVFYTINYKTIRKIEANAIAMNKTAL